MTDEARQFVISLTRCNTNDCWSEADSIKWLESKSIALLYNERFLDLNEPESSAPLKEDLYDLFSVDGAFSHNTRNDVVEQSHFHLIKVNA